MLGASVVLHNVQSFTRVCMHTKDIHMYTVASDAACDNKNSLLYVPLLQYNLIV